MPPRRSNKRPLTLTQTAADEDTTLTLPGVESKEETGERTNAPDVASTAATTTSSLSDYDHPTTTTTTTSMQPPPKKRRKRPNDLATNTTDAAADAAAGSRRAPAAAAVTKKKLVVDEDVAMKDVTQTDVSTHAGISTFAPPHGILKLPQSVASTLASDFLRKREIRDLGVTCRWMLVSLNLCEIKEPVSLKSAIHRINRERLSHGPTKKVSARTENFRATVARVPNLFVGKFRNVEYHNPSMPMADIRLFSVMDRLNDVHHLSLYLNVARDKLKYPILLPSQLKTLSFGFTTSGLRSFILPITLQSIRFNSNCFEDCLTQVTWPQPSQLKELINLSSKEPVDGLRLPEGLETGYFHPDMHQPITNLTLPNSVTNLQIGRWTKNGCYHDLVFPSSLRRLVLTVDYAIGDLDLTKWTGLPVSCENLQLILIETRRDLSTATAPTPIVIPGYVKQLRLNRFSRYLQFPLPTLDLSHATSLASFLTDSVDAIQWPLNSTALVKLKLEEPKYHDSRDQLFWYGLKNRVISTSPFPDSLLELDLLDTNVPFTYTTPWTDPFIPYQTGVGLIFPPHLVRLKLPQVEAAVKFQPSESTPPPCPNLVSWSHLLPNCTIEGRCDHETVMTSLYNRSAMRHSHIHMRYYKNGVLTHEARKDKWRDTDLRRADEDDKQQYDTVPTTHTTR